MQKRGIIGTITMSVLAAAFILTPITDVSADSDKKTFVLVHGAFGDQAVWDGPDADKGVAEKLREKGYRVVTVTLPGLGRNHAQASESMNLTDHVQYVANVLEINGVTDAIMVCHSYGGMVCAAIQDMSSVSDRIDKMVFFDADVPESGESFFSSIGMPLPVWFPSLEVFYQTLGMPVPEVPWCFPSLDPEEAFRLTGEDADWLRKLQTCQPIHTFDEPLTFNWNDDVKKYFVHADDPNNPPWFSYTEFLNFRQRAEDMGWNMYTISDSHYVAISDPKAVVQALTLIDNVPDESWPFN
jgi:pimeloyl-ACP methyl ester carboxylesterase